MIEVGNLLDKIIDPITIMIRVVGLMTGCFYFYENLYDLSIFLKCPPRILGGFMWRLKRSLQLVKVSLYANLWDYLYYFYNDIYG